MFPSSNPKRHKRNLKRTDVASTPIAIRSRVELAPSFSKRVRERLAKHLGHAATLIERGTVRFDDVNGPRGGVDSICRIKLVLSGRPSIQVEKRGSNAEAAFAATLPALKTAVARTAGKHALRAGPRTAKIARATPRPAAAADAGELIGRRVGRSGGPLQQALSRPEKVRRDAYVDTAKPGVNATDRKAGGEITARRNSRARTSRTTVMLEDSRAKPSRKSTRRSATRSKPSHGKERAAVARTTSASARSARATAKRGGRLA